MQGFEFACPTKIVCGQGALDKIGSELESLKVARPFVITDQGLVQFGVAQRLYAALEASGIPYEVFDRVPPDSSLEAVQEVEALYEEKGCDGFIAIGGGSVIDTTKGAAASLSCKGADFATLQGSEILNQDLPPLIAIPTTAGTGSEVTLVAVVADQVKHVKLSFTSYKLVPHTAILDPALTSTLPPKLTATTGMDAMTHAIEAYTSIQKNPISDAFAICALRLLSENLFTACADGHDADARTALALGSLMAGAAFSNAMVGIVHAIGHSLGGLCHVPHGQAMTMLLPHCIDYNIAHGVHAGLYGQLLGYVEGAPHDVVAQDRDKAFARLIHEYNERLHSAYGVPLRLSELGVGHDALDAVAEQARYDGAALYNSTEITIETARALLEEIY